MDSLKKADRPKFLDLFRIRLPITGIVSILHRVSGVLLLLAIPFFIYILQTSLASEAEFIRIKETLNQPLIEFLFLILCWAIAHHFFAGIRFLLFDIDIGVTKQSAQKMARLVFAAEAVAFLILVGVFL